MILRWIGKWMVLFVVWVAIIAAVGAIHEGLGLLVFFCIAISAIEEMFGAIGIGPRS